MIFFTKLRGKNTFFKSIDDFTILRFYQHFMFPVNINRNHFLWQLLITICYYCMSSIIIKGVNLKKCKPPVMVKNVKYCHMPPFIILFLGALKSILCSEAYYWNFVLTNSFWTCSEAKYYHLPLPKAWFVQPCSVITSPGYFMCINSITRHLMYAVCCYQL